MRRIAYIPARSGSKGIPKKNIRPLFGKPLMGWMIDAALKTGLFDRVMVSTDTEEFADVARECGAWVPFLRDQEVAKDTTSSIETVCSDKERLEAMGETFDVFCMLQPTAPLCQASDISGAVALFEAKGAGVVSVKTSSVRPTLLRCVSEDGRSSPVLSSSLLLRRQDESRVCEINGAIYINFWSDLNRGLKQAYNPYAYVMDDVSSIDIDTEDDWALAEEKVRLRSMRLGYVRLDHQ